VLSPHVLDVPFTFDHLKAPGIVAFFGLSNASDQPLADAMHSAMVSFVQGGAPRAPAFPCGRATCRRNGQQWSSIKRRFWLMILTGRSA
jgi:hypothetical protein